MVGHTHARERSLVAAAPRSRHAVRYRGLLALLLATGLVAGSRPASAELLLPAGSPVAVFLAAHEGPQIAYQQTPFPPREAIGGDAVAAPMAPPSSIDPPAAGEAPQGFWELAIGSCAGGALAGAVTAATATAPIAATGIGVQAVASVVLLAAGSGCVVGIASASISLGSVLGWQRLGRIGPVTSY